MTRTGIWLWSRKMKERRQSSTGSEGAKKLQEEWSKWNFRESGGGLVKVILSGNQEPRRCRNFPDVLGEGAEVLSDLVTAAMKDAYNKSTFTMRERMEELTSGLELPGM